MTDPIGQEFAGNRSEAIAADDTLHRALDEPRQALAGRLDRVASTVREAGRKLPGGALGSGAAHMAKRLGQAAGYIRSHCTRDMLANVTAAVPVEILRWFGRP